MELIGACDCGKVRARIDTAHVRGNRVVCYCDDCQAGARYFGKADRILDASGGTEVLPVPPGNFRLVAGADQLRALRVEGSGLQRWFAGCCRSPVGNQVAKVPYIGIVHTFLGKENDQAEVNRAFGPIRFYSMGKFARGPVPDGTDRESYRFRGRILRIILLAYLFRRARPRPFPENEKERTVEISPEEWARFRAERAAGA